MVDPQTTNLQLFTPANGADVGSWDVPVNANWNQIEAVFTANASIPLSNLPITLSGAQYNTSLITFTGTLTANVTVTFPAFARNWTLFNNCLGNPQSLTVLCKTAASTIYVALPPGEPIQVFSDGTNMRFMGLGRIGSYIDLGSSTIPAWITNTVPQPYLNCDGTSFSSASYPALRDYLGTNVLPDSRSRLRYALDQGTNRTNFNFTLGAGAGSASIPQSALPNYSLPVTDPGHAHSITDPGHNHSFVLDTAPGGAGIPLTGFGAAQQTAFTNNNTTGIAVNLNGTNITVNSGGSGTQFSPPCYTGGLTLIRAG